jgi:hypothetical protein
LILDFFRAIRTLGTWFENVGLGESIVASYVVAVEVLRNTSGACSV